MRHTFKTIPIPYIDILIKIINMFIEHQCKHKQHKTPASHLILFAIFEQK